MKLNAIGVTTTNLKKTVKFYETLGFEFPEHKENEEHLESTTGGIKLMIDSFEMTKSILGVDPKPSNHSAFAIEYSSADELNAIAAKVKLAGYEVVKEPWDAFWGQRYCVVKDPDGYMVDLYAQLKN